jgi:low temperature requirement protein LtrA
MTAGTTNDASLLRPRDGHEAPVSTVELFFDLVYVFAVTQLSHRLLENLTVTGAVETLVLWFAVWLGWQYTCWFTNWFDPEATAVRLVLFVVMLLGLVMSAAIPDAFGLRGWVFAACYVAMQIGRTLFVVLSLPRKHPLAANFARILGWLCIAAIFWIAGALTDGSKRLLLWSAAAACEYFSPMIGFWLPGVGRSQTADWTIEGGHFAERCQLFVIVALGESILVTGATLSGTIIWHPQALITFLVAFAASVAMWWIYFNTGSRAGRHAITHSPDPGRLGAWFHYVHATLVGGIIVMAVATELWIAHPAGHAEWRELVVSIAGATIYLFGNGVYKTVVYGRFPLSHMLGLAALAILLPFGTNISLLALGSSVTAILIVVAAWETLSRRSARVAAEIQQT